MKVIAVDFDGCLCENKWPDIGNPNWPTIQRLKNRQASGDKVILWTCRDGERLEEAVSWCMNHGLKFDAVNDNLPDNITKYKNNCRKVWADEYWDDKAVVIGIGHYYSMGFNNIYLVENGSPMPTDVKTRLRFLFTGRM